MKKTVAVIFLCVAVLLSSCFKPQDKFKILQNTRELVLGSSENVTTQLSVLVPDGELLWKSSDDGVAAVSSTGLVTAVGAGLVTITVTGEHKKASCKIHVYQAPQAVKLSKESISLKPGGTGMLRAKIEPAAHVRQSDMVITWISSDTEVASVNAKGKVQAVGPGTADIKALTANGIMAVCQVTVR